MQNATSTTTTRQHSTLEGSAHVKNTHHSQLPYFVDVSRLRTIFATLTKRHFRPQAPRRRQRALGEGLSHKGSPRMVRSSETITVCLAKVLGAIALFALHHRTPRVATSMHRELPRHCAMKLLWYVPQEHHTMRAVFADCHETVRAQKSVCHRLADAAKRNSPHTKATPRRHPLRITQSRTSGTRWSLVSKHLRNETLPATCLRRREQRASSKTLRESSDGTAARHYAQFVEEKLLESGYLVHLVLPAAACVGASNSESGWSLQQTLLGGGLLGGGLLGTGACTHTR
ncbi:hypothetical protein Q7P37_004393 [Cladosporium fusiforme]